MSTAVLIVYVDSAKNLPVRFKKKKKICINLPERRVRDDFFIFYYDDDINMNCIFSTSEGINNRTCISKQESVVKYNERIPY